MPELPHRFIPDSEKAIAVGGEKQVYPEGKRKVRKFYYEDENITPRYIKMEYYLTKIVHFLFPKQIPDIHFAGIEKQGQDDSTFQTVHERVMINDRSHEIITDHYTKEMTSELGEEDDTQEVISAAKEVMTRPEVKTLIRNLKRVGIESADFLSANFATDQEGNTVYLDSFFGFDRYEGGVDDIKGFNEKKLKRAIMKKLQSPEREQALAYLERLNALYEEELRHSRET